MYFLSGEERLIYVNQGAIHSSNGNGAIIPTHPNGSLFTISTTSEGDSENSTVIAVHFTNKHGEYMTLHIFEDERFVIDADYHISIYNKKSGKLVKKGHIENLLSEQ